MPIITLDAGKMTVEQKKELIKRFTDTVEQVTNIPKEYTTVIIRENAQDNIGVGGESLSDMKKRIQSNK